MIDCGPNSAIAIFTCACGESIVLPLKAGPGNDFDAVFPENWYPGFSDNKPYIRCPAHNKFAGGTEL
jgi:hypothetical protein